MDFSLLTLIIGFIVFAIILTQLPKRFIAKYPQYKDNKKVQSFLTSPIPNPFICLGLYYINQNILAGMVTFVDSLRMPSTYTPFLGDFGKIIDFIDENGWLPEIGRSQEISDAFMLISVNNTIIFLGFLIIIVLNGISIYRMFHLGQYSIQNMFRLNFLASIILIITSIIFTLNAVEIYDDGIWYAILTVVILYAIASINVSYKGMQELKVNQTVNTENKENSLENIVVNKENKSSVSTKEISVYLGIILFVALGLFLIINREKSSYATIDDNQSKNITITNVYEQRTNAIIQELTSQYGDNIKVEYKYPESSRFCIFGYKGVDDYDFRFIWIYDLEKETIKRIDTQSLFIIRNSEEVFLFSYNLSLDSKNNRLLISGDNGANGIGYTEYVLELDLTNMRLKEICSGSSIVKNNDGYVVERRFMTRWGSNMAMSEYANFDVLYNLDGNPVLPPAEGSNIYQLKGFINEIYPITMQLLIKDNKFYGRYYYDKNGSNNFLYLYGGVSESGDIILLEFTNDGEQTGNFLGRFTNNSFHGTFTNNEKTEMPFLLK